MTFEQRAADIDRYLTAVDCERIIARLHERGEGPAYLLESRLLAQRKRDGIPTTPSGEQLALF